MVFLSVNCENTKEILLDKYQLLNSLLKNNENLINYFFVFAGL
jgi:hypothetical protein